MKKRLFFLGCLISLLITALATTSCNMEVPETKETVKITYSTERGTLPYELTRIVEKGHILTDYDLPILSFDGYEFNGWNYANGKSAKTGDKIDSNIILYAIWTKIINPEVINLISYPLDRSVKLTWVNPSNTNFTGVEIEYTADDNTTTKKVVEPNLNAFTITELTNGKKYTFKVIACYNNGIKSKGISTESTPKAEYLNIETYLSTNENSFKPIIVTVNVTSSEIITSIKYAKDIHNKEYFELNGTDITDSKSFTVTENGPYTLCAKDNQGNEVVEVININNINTTRAKITGINLEKDKFTSSESGKQIKVDITGTDFNILNILNQNIEVAITQGSTIIVNPVKATVDYTNNKATAIIKLPTVNNNEITDEGLKYNIEVYTTDEKRSSLTKEITFTRNAVNSKAIISGEPTLEKVFFPYPVAAGTRVILSFPVKNASVVSNISVKVFDNNKQIGTTIQAQSTDSKNYTVEIPVNNNISSYTPKIYFDDVLQTKLCYGEHSQSEHDLNYQPFFVYMKPKVSNANLNPSNKKDIDSITTAQNGGPTNSFDKFCGKTFPFRNSQYNSGYSERISGVITFNRDGTFQVSREGNIKAKGKYKVDANFIYYQLTDSYNYELNIFETMEEAYNRKLNNNPYKYLSLRSQDILNYYAPENDPNREGLLKYLLREDLAEYNTYQFRYKVLENEKIELTTNFDDINTFPRDYYKLSYIMPSLEQSNIDRNSTVSFISNPYKMPTKEGVYITELISGESILSKLEQTGTGADRIIKLYIDNTHYIAYSKDSYGVHRGYLFENVYTAELSELKKKVNYYKNNEGLKEPYYTTGGDNEDPFKNHTYYSPDKTLKMEIMNNGTGKCYSKDSTDVEYTPAFNFTYKYQGYAGREYRLAIWQTQQYCHINGKAGLKNYDDLYNFFINDSKSFEEFKKNPSNSGLSENELKTKFEVETIKILLNNLIRETSSLKFNVVLKGAYGNEFDSLEFTSICPYISSLKDLYEFNDVGFFSAKATPDNKDNLKFLDPSFITLNDSYILGLNRNCHINHDTAIFEKYINDKGTPRNKIGDEIVRYSINQPSLTSESCSFDITINSETKHFRYVPIIFSMSVNNTTTK